MRPCISSLEDTLLFFSVSAMPSNIVDKGSIKGGQMIKIVTIQWMCEYAHPQTSETLHI